MPGMSSAINVTQCRVAASTAPSYAISAMVHGRTKVRPIVANVDVARRAAPQAADRAVRGALLTTDGAKEAAPLTARGATYLEGTPSRSTVVALSSRAASFLRAVGVSVALLAASVTAVPPLAGAYAALP